MSAPFARTPKSKKLINQAQDLGGQLREQLAPHVENARDQLAPRLADAKDQLGPMLADARDAAAPHVAEVRDRINSDVIPAVQSALADAREQAGPMAEEARRRGVAAAYALKGEQPPKKGGKGKWFALVALLGGAAIAAKKLLGGDNGSHGAYTSSYTPPAPARTTTSAPSTDPAGASPGEALADSADGPSAVSTPDDPAEETKISEQP